VIGGPDRGRRSAIVVEVDVSRAMGSHGGWPSPPQFVEVVFRTVWSGDNTLGIPLTIGPDLVMTRVGLSFVRASARDVVDEKCPVSLTSGLWRENCRRADGEV